jgi:tetratricopeptide (TPR) repeat protein
VASTQLLNAVAVCAQLEGSEEMPKTSIEGMSAGKDQWVGISEFKGEYIDKLGDNELAIEKTRRALQADPDDMEAHLMYAKLLERKLRMQPLNEKDPKLFQTCVSEWLKIFRNEVGEEKGDSWHGIAPIGRLYQDEDHTLLAKQHITALCGFAPKVWETDSKFMDKVTKNSVHAQIVKPSQAIVQPDQEATTVVRHSSSARTSEASSGPSNF